MHVWSHITNDLKSNLWAPLVLFCTNGTLVLKLVQVKVEFFHHNIKQVNFLFYRFSIRDNEKESFKDIIDHYIYCLDLEKIYNFPCWNNGKKN